MSRRLAKDVHLNHPETLEPTILRAGTTVPEWADDLVTNPKAFTEQPDFLDANDVADSESFFSAHEDPIQMGGTVPAPIPTADENESVVLAEAETTDVEGAKRRTRNR